MYIYVYVYIQLTGMLVPNININHNLLWPTSIILQLTSSFPIKPGYKDPRPVHLCTLAHGITGVLRLLGKPSPHVPGIETSSYEGLERSSNSRVPIKPSPVRLAPHWWGFYNECSIVSFTSTWVSPRLFSIDERVFLCGERWEHVEAVPSTCLKHSWTYKRNSNDQGIGCISCFHLQRWGMCFSLTHWETLRTSSVTVASHHSDRPSVLVAPQRTGRNWSTWLEQVECFFGGVN